MSEFSQVVKEGWLKIWSWIKRFFLILILLAVAGSGAFVWVSSWTYSDGARAGHLVKMTKKGVLFKTYEGQLNLGGFQSDPQSGVMGNIWDFSVTKKDVFTELQKFEGKHIKVHYHERYRSFFWQGDTKYFVDKVELVEQ
jgi:hypothetical protein